MSRSSAKERSRVQDSGRHISTFRIMDNFGSWKYSLPKEERPILTPLSRRFIGGKNSGRKLALSRKLIEVRKPTERMVAKFEEDLWSGPEFKLVTVKTGSNYPNPKKLRRMAKELAMAEMTAILEDRRDALEQERLEEADRNNWGYHHFF